MRTAEENKRKKAEMEARADASTSRGAQSQQTFKIPDIPLPKKRVSQKKLDL